MAKITIMLDPGHDTANYNRSNVVKSYYEGARMWRLYQLLRAALEARGIAVKGTKSQVNQAVDVTARGRMAKGCTALISLHSNACGTESVDRPEGIYFVDDDCGKIDDTSKALAVQLSQTVAKIMGTRDKAKQYAKLAGSDRDGDGKKNDDYYGVLYGAHQVGVPAIILEHSFHTNTRAASWLMQDSNLQRLANALADDLAKYFKVQASAPTAPTAAQRLASLGVIDSPEYWETAQHRLEYLPELLEALADAAGSKIVASTETAQAAIQRLVDCHVIKSPGYWLQHHGDVQHLDALLVKAANRIGTAAGSQTAQEAPKWYRVRKSWDDAASQLGAFLNLSHAKLACAAGYTVYDWTGKAVYTNKPKKTIDQVAREVIAGKWGNGDDRRKRLEAAGYDYKAVQARVNELL